MTTITIDQMAESLSALLAQRLRVSGPTLAIRVQRAKSSLPRPVRRAALELVAAHQIAQSPKLRAIAPQLRPDPNRPCAITKVGRSLS